MEIFIEPFFSEYYSKNPLVLVDVGASGGLEPRWKLAQKYLYVIGFEPDPREFTNLQKKENKMVKYLNIGLHREKTSLTYYLMQKQQTSSMFKPNREFLDKFPEAERFDIVKKVIIETDTLDNQFKMHNIFAADFIKVDTQGSELFILEGAAQTIRDYVFGLEVEVEFNEMYQGQPLFSDVDSFIRKQKFQLFDLQTAHWKRAVGKNYHKKRGQLIFGNALYFRKIDDFAMIVNNIKDVNEKKCKVLKAISICFLYGYFDYAKEIFDINAKLFDKSQRRAIEEFFKRSERYENFIPNFRGRTKLAGWIYSLWEVMRPTHDKWATLERKLGNV